MASSWSSQQSLPSREVHAHTQPTTFPILASPEEKSSLPHQPSPCPDFWPAPAYSILSAFSCNLRNDQFFMPVHAPAPLTPQKRRGTGRSSASPRCNGRGWVKRASLGRSVFKKQLLAGKTAIPAFLGEGIRMMSPPARWQEHSCPPRAAPACATNIYFGLFFGSFPLQGITAGWTLLL